MGLFGKKKSDVIAVIDIGSASVGGMLINTSQDCPEIITSKRVPINFLFDVDFQAYLRSTLTSLEKVLISLLKDYPSGPDKVFCVFSLLWGVSQTRIVKLKKEAPVKINKNFLEKLIQDEINIFKSEWQYKAPYFKDNADLIEHEIMKVALNGYYIEHPFNKTAKTIDVYTYLSLIVESIKKRAENSFLKNFGDVKVVFHTLPFVVYVFLRDILHTEEGFVFAEIGGETSDLSLVRDNILEETVSFPKGKNLFIRQIATEFKTFIGEAESMLRSYRDKHLDSSVSEKISSLVGKVSKEWSDSLYEVLTEIAENAPLPKRFFLVGDRNITPEIIDYLQNEPFSRFTVLGKPFEVEEISPEALKHYFKFKRNFEREKDNFLMIESLFANSFFR